MCRLPQDVMTMIIRLLKRPLPEHGDKNATWADLHQDDLTKMMRVSKVVYHIAAPILYEEVVVDNLLAFFTGVDDPVQPHHQGCGHPVGDQRFICAHVTRGDRAYDCSRHPLSSAPLDAVASRPSLTLYHKQEMVAMVQAFHLVYSAEDERVYDDFHHAVGDDQDVELAKLYSLAGFERYTGAGHRIYPLTGKYDLTPKLKRMTLGSWMTKRWNARHARLTALGDYDQELEFRFFEERLAVTIFPLEAEVLCRYSNEGFFAQYPGVDKFVPVIICNVLHLASYDTYGRSLIPGARNIVHFEIPKFTSAIDDFVDSTGLLVGELASIVRRWADDDVPVEEVDDTRITFCVHRSSSLSTPSLFRRIQRGERNPPIEAIVKKFEDALDAWDEDLLDGWKEKCEIIWADEAVPCPACGADYGDEEDEEDDCSGTGGSEASD